MAADKGSKQGAEGEVPDKRTQILDAAIKVLCEQGFAKAKIRDIARTAGVADGTIYLYFDNKDDLLIRLFEEVMKRALAIFKGAVVQTDGARKKLRTFVQTQLAFLDREPELAHIISIELRQSSTFIRDYNNVLFQEYLNIVGGIIEEGIASGEFRGDTNVDLVKRALFGATDEITVAWVLSGGGFDITETADELADVFIRGICAQ